MKNRYVNELELAISAYNEAKARGSGLKALNALNRMLLTAALYDIYEDKNKHDSQNSSTAGFEKTGLDDVTPQDFKKLKAAMVETRVFGVGKTRKEKALTIAKNLSRIVVGIGAASATILSWGLDLAGIAIKFIPVVGFVMDRIPFVSYEEKIYETGERKTTLNTSISDSRMDDMGVTKYILDPLMGKKSLTKNHNFVKGLGEVASKIAKPLREYAAPVNSVKEDIFMRRERARRAKASQKENTTLIEHVFRR